MRTYIRVLFGVFAISAVATLSTGCNQRASNANGPLTQLYARLPDSKINRKEVDLLNYAGLAKTLNGAAPEKLPELVVKLMDSDLGVPLTFAPLTPDVGRTWEATYGFPLGGIATVATIENGFLFDGVAASTVESTLKRNKEFGKRLLLRTEKKRKYFTWNNEGVDVVEGYHPIANGGRSSLETNVAVTGSHSVLVSTSKDSVRMALSENKPEKLLSSWDPGYSSVHAAEAAGSLFIAVVGGPRDRPALQPGMGLDRFSEEQVRKNDSNLYHVPDLAMALGMGKSNGKPALILVYAHANKADAQLHASRFAKLIERGTSTNQLTPWKDKFHRSRIESRGKLMIAVLETDHPSYGFESLATNDNLV